MPHVFFRLKSKYNFVLNPRGKMLSCELNALSKYDANYGYLIFLFSLAVSISGREKVGWWSGISQRTVGSCRLRVGVFGSRSHGIWGSVLSKSYGVMHVLVVAWSWHSRRQRWAWPYFSWSRLLPPTMVLAWSAEQSQGKVMNVWQELYTFYGAVFFPVRMD